MACPGLELGEVQPPPESPQPELAFTEAQKWIEDWRQGNNKECEKKGFCAKERFSKGITVRGMKMVISFTQLEEAHATTSRLAVSSSQRPPISLRADLRDELCYEVVVAKHQDWKGSFCCVLNDVMIEDLDKNIPFRAVKQNYFSVVFI
ncbi:hypothetical protein WISP_83746 [Willisornis vidua]|uniref:Uncharacterized protein n=1 Tax=Willisornis vidua TaxID=1566151 RepID=A0ABQ9D8W3_9PASS|nr:hypothetical protein WISP_83746 [Willisornis vidua]